MLGRYLTEKSGKSVEVVDCCYYIPLHDSLQALLRMDVVQDEVSGTANVQSSHVTGIYTIGDEFTSIKQWIVRGLLRWDTVC